MTETAPTYEQAIEALRAIGAVFRIGLWRSRECTERIVEAVKRSERWRHDTSMALFAAIGEREDLARRMGERRAKGLPIPPPIPVYGHPMPDDERAAIAAIVRAAERLTRTAAEFWPEYPEALAEDLDELDRARGALDAVYEARPTVGLPLPAVEPATPGEIHAAAVARAEADASLRVTCDVCEGRATTRTVGPDGATAIDTPCPRCRGRGWRPLPKENGANP